MICYNMKWSHQKHLIPPFISLKAFKMRPLMNYLKWRKLERNSPNWSKKFFNEHDKCRAINLFSTTLKLTTKVIRKKLTILCTLQSKRSFSQLRNLWSLSKEAKQTSIPKENNGSTTAEETRLTQIISRIE